MNFRLATVVVPHLLRSFIAAKGGVVGIAALHAGSEVRLRPPHDLDRRHVEHG